MATRKQSNSKADDTIVNIVDASEGAQDFFEKNQNMILGVIGGLAIIIGGYFAYTHLYQAPRQAEAVEQMFQAQFQFEQDSFALALSNPGGGYGGFLDIIDNYSGTKAANLAKYYAGVCYLNLGQYESAVDNLEGFNPKGKVTPIMKFGALGDAYSELGDLDKAASMYSKAAKADENDVLTPYYLKKLGMLLEYKQDYSGALKAYEEIKKDYPTAPDAQNIDKYIVRVSGQ